VKKKKKMPPRNKPPPPREPSESSHSDEEEEDGTDVIIESVDPVDFIKSLPVEKRRRVYALKGLTKKYRAERAKLRAELDRLAVEFQQQIAPLFEARRQIVNGEREATDEEVRAGTNAEESHVEEVPSDEDTDKAAKAGAKKKSVKVSAPGDNDAKSALEAAAASPTGGIPAFWLTALRNNEVVESIIQPKDEDALRYLTDITAKDLPNHAGFQLSFHFKQNPFFTDSVLTKTYFTEPPSTSDDCDDGDAITRSEGCPINWTSAEKNLLVVIKQKKQRHKIGKGVRINQREERDPSFFWFFYPPYDPED